MATVTLTNHGGTFEATPIHDKHLSDAIELAQLLKSAGYTFTQAHVDRADGLIVFGHIGSNMGSWYFWYPRCGDRDPATNATARILELLGFGEYADIMEVIIHGGERAHYTFTR